MYRIKGIHGVDSPAIREIPELDIYQWSPDIDFMLIPLDFSEPSTRIIGKYNGYTDHAGSEVLFGPEDVVVNGLFRRDTWRSRPVLSNIIIEGSIEVLGESAINGKKARASLDMRTKSRKSRSSSTPLGFLDIFNLN